MEAEPSCPLPAAQGGCGRDASETILLEVVGFEGEDDTVRISGSEVHVRLSAELRSLVQQRLNEAAVGR
ncbi:hypothetical protein [Symbiobacterium thermophilum]|uniref:Uncharacterized protein n=1 Tax=Symbiobacterium thermophilum TaxID=2734 RepID=A0A1Y2T4G0_SYMTR|nr:hypothetical protein [Symbiobacterium thermophilum]MBY6275302.1 hypothetical protein [Symbiobacterium thermophilum]OTA41189.1 MAG: hypothetical protein A6D92_09075 [Symbiobacterium thermophilum]